MVKFFKFVLCNLCQSSPSLPSWFLYGLLLYLWCFSISGKYYFRVSFNFKAFLSMVKITVNHDLLNRSRTS